MHRLRSCSAVSCIQLATCTCTLQAAIPQPPVVLEQSLNLTVAFQLAVKFLGSLSTHRIISLALGNIWCASIAVSAP